MRYEEKKKDKELKDRIKEAKKIRKNLKHPYLGTEHLIASILELKEYSDLLEITQEDFLKKMQEIIGIGNETKENVGYTPMLSDALRYSSTVLEFIMEIFLSQQQGIAYRIFAGLKSDEDYERILENINNYYDYKNPLLDMPSYLTNLNAKEYVTNPAIGRDSIIEEMEKVLLKMNKPNVLLVGKAGVGKTAIAEGLAYRIQKGEVNERLKDKIIVSVATSTLVAGTRYRGEFEEKVEKLCQYLKEHPRIILFIDEMHTSVKAGASEGGLDMANILKPYLARGEIKVIGATTLDEREIITKDSAYNRRFTTLLIKEPTLRMTNKILKESIPKFEKFYDIKIDDKLIDYIVDKSLNLKGELPDKAIDLLENVCADTIWNNDKKFTKKDVERVIETIEERQKLLEV